MSSEYGWSKDFILSRVYPDESLIYIKLIDERRRNDYLMGLAIVTNPMLKSDDQKVLWNILSKKDSRRISTKIDKEGIAMFKRKLLSSKKIKVK